MRLAILFTLTVFVPTAILSFFGLKALRSEAQIVADILEQKHSSIVDIIISDALTGTGSSEERVRMAASLFKGEVAVQNSQGEYLPDYTPPATSKEMYSKSFQGYRIISYERYPERIAQRDATAQGVLWYMGLMFAAVILLICGGFMTVRALGQEWDKARLKSEFVSHLSHDIRRPLTSIKMFSEMLLDGRYLNEDKQREYYQVIARESERLTHLADNILDFSRLEQGRMTYNFTICLLRPLIDEVVGNVHRYLLDAPRDIVLSWEGQSGEVGKTAEVEVDKTAVKQALYNLIGNAVKYSPSQSAIAVRVSCEADMLSIAVEDEGLGIAAEEIPFIFDRYYRCQSLKVRDREGSGLGLTLVAECARAHGGRVEVVSREGEGSTFTFVISTKRDGGRVDAYTGS